LLLRAVARAAPYLEHYDISVAPSSRIQESDRTKELRKSDEGAKQSLAEVIGLASADRVSRGFDEADFFNGPDSKVSLHLSELISGSERPIQASLPKCIAYHGLRGLRQVPVMGEITGFRIRDST
jgi:hypothetical protein